jgi:hypothetical protein
VPVQMFVRAVRERFLLTVPVRPANISTLSASHYSGEPLPFMTLTGILIESAFIDVQFAKVSCP